MLLAFVCHFQKRISFCVCFAEIDQLIYDDFASKNPEDFSVKYLPNLLASKLSLIALDI